MQSDMKKKILIIALVCILAGVAAFYIVKVNNMYPQGSVTEYEINEQIELSGYSACVNSYKVNKDVNFSKFEQGTSITVDVPFLIHSISFPHSINADKLNKEEWQLYFSVTPGKYVRMGK